MTEDNKKESIESTEIIAPGDAIDVKAFYSLMDMMKEQANKTVVTRPVIKNAFLQPESLDDVFTLSRNLALSGMMGFKEKDAPERSIRVLMGMELGFSALQSIRNIYNVHGHPVPKADALVALVVKSPVCVYFKKVDIESNDKACTVETLRTGASEPQRYTFSIADAATAGLMGKSTWKNYPAVMLYKRASAFLCREVYPDVCANLSTVEEMESMAMDDAERLESEKLEAQKLRVDAEAAITEYIETFNPAFSGHLIDSFWCAKRF